MVSTGFARLRLGGWRQFEDIDLDLSHQVTILTGENGTGKSTLLTILADQFDRSKFPFVGLPEDWESPAIADPTTRAYFGELLFLTGEVSRMAMNARDRAQFNIAYSSRQTIPGVYLDSHRPSGGYQKVDHVPARFTPPAELAREYTKIVRAQQLSGQVTKTPGLALKESLIAAALYAEGTRYVRPDPFASEVWRGFQDVLSQLFPPSLGFRQLAIANGEVLVDTRSGSFPIEAASGGLHAIMDLGWQVFLASHSEPVFTVCFDEPENHLHPSLQRSILPSLIRAFPRLRLVVATHSPFVVTSVRDAHVYAMRRYPNGRVSAQMLDFQAQAFAADQVLRDVLGVDSTLPLWAESKLSSILQEFQSRPLTPERAARMQAELDAGGLKFLMPDALPDFPDDRQ